MANYGPSGAGSQPWHEPRPDEWYGHDRQPGTQPPDDPGQPHAPGHTYGGPPPHGGGQTYGGRTYGGGQGYDPRYGSGPGGSPYDGAAAGYGAYPQGDPTQPVSQGGPMPRDDAASAYAGTPVPPPARGGGRGRFVALLAAVLVLVLGGVTAAFVFGGDDEAPAPVAAPTQEAAPPSDEPGDEETAPGDPASNSSTDPRFVRAGQCVRNDAPAGDKPRLLISDCAAESYEVLRRFDGKTSGERDAEAKCAQVDGYTNWYFYDSELDSLDFVLCLKQRN